MNIFSCVGVWLYCPVDNSLNKSAQRSVAHEKLQAVYKIIRERYPAGRYWVGIVAVAPHDSIQCLCMWDWLQEHCPDADAVWTDSLWAFNNYEMAPASGIEGLHCAASLQDMKRRELHWFKQMESCRKESRWKGLYFCSVVSSFDAATQRIDSLDGDASIDLSSLANSTSPLKGTINSTTTEVPILPAIASEESSAMRTVRLARLAMQHGVDCVAAIRTPGAIALLEVEAALTATVDISLAGDEPELSALEASVYPLALSAGHSFSPADATSESEPSRMPDVNKYKYGCIFIDVNQASCRKAVSAAATAAPTASSHPAKPHNGAAACTCPESDSTITEDAFSVVSGTSVAAFSMLDDMRTTSLHASSSLHIRYSVERGPILAVSDLHGNIALLKKAIQRGIEISRRPDLQVILMGDYVDNGPDVPALLEYMSTDGWKSEFPDIEIDGIMGNHDLACLLASEPTMFNMPASYRYRGQDWWTRWIGRFQNSGGETHKQYGAVSQIEFSHAFPVHHKAWLTARPWYWIEDQYLFVHAGTSMARLLRC